MNLPSLSKLLSDYFVCRADIYARQYVKENRVGFSCVSERLDECVWQCHLSGETTVPDLHQQGLHAMLKCDKRRIDFCVPL